ncbi:MAG: DHH family phosphoesterase [Candidatus Pacearchaeota archaeon]|jgi:single-stranded DNA-specific DHH superfamily exonuclease
MKYLLGSEKEFFEFVNSISKKDKIGLISHTDLDGIASAVFLQKILESKDLKLNFIKFLEYGSEVLKPILNEKIDVLFFTDWNADNFPKDLDLLRKKFRVLVFDHHPLNPELKDEKGIIKTERIYCSSHALFDLIKEKNYFDTQKMTWLVCAAIISDYTWDKSDEAFELIKKFYPNVKKDSSIWNSEPGLIGKKISGALIYYNPNFKKVYEKILKNDLNSLEKVDKIVQKEIEKYLHEFEEKAEHFSKEKLYFYYNNPKFQIASSISSIISDRYFRDSTVIFVTDIKNRKGFVKVSARNQTMQVNLGNLLKNCIEGFENSSGGGHIQAASAIFPKKYLNKFKENLLKELKN